MGETRDPIFVVSGLRASLPSGWNRRYVTDLSPQDRRREAGDLGRDPAVTERAIQLSQDLVAKGAAPVLTLGELAFRTGAPARYLREIVDRRSDPYNEIVRPKRDGSTRPISSPEPVLMDVHRWC